MCAAEKPVHTTFLGGDENIGITIQTNIFFGPESLIYLKSWDIYIGCMNKINEKAAAQLGQQTSII